MKFQESQETNGNLIVGKISETGYQGESVYYVAYDKENRVLHLLDDSKHRSTSLINLFNTVFKDDVLNLMGIKNKKVQCLLYHYISGNWVDDGIICEYKFKTRETIDHLSPSTVEKIGYSPFYHAVYNKP